MPDFSKLLNKPAGQAVSPKALPPGDYPGVIKSWAMVEAPAGKDYTSMVRFQLTLTGWPDDVEEDDRVQETADGPVSIDPGKRAMRKDFFDHRLDMLDDFIRSCGIDPSGRAYGEVLPETVGCAVIVGVGQYVNQRSNELMNQVNGITGQN